ncbi:MAG: creatininase family protein [Deltaproteobacteria bacterium]|nr:MAG: creatininase family protein [Deltaproteobacteria bacterium]TMQ16566.1 MAG: creatininase family protein [Deltaproteobacteria bacterium]
MTTEKFLARHTTASLRALLDAKKPVVALVPIGSTEPHGPHLALGTDVVISAAACVRATELFAKKGPLTAVIAPAVSYGVTDCAQGFAGAVSVPAAALTAYLAAICDGLLAQGIRHVCLVNNHLEPAHDAAVRAAVAGRGNQVSVACPLTKKWARTLDAEFKSGACHAGLYETSIMLAAAPEMVDDAVRGVLPPVPISLSKQLDAGVTTFAAMGMELAYAGDPAAATIEEGERMILRLAEMVVGEVREALGLPT